MSNFSFRERGLDGGSGTGFAVMDSRQPQMGTEEAGYFVGGERIRHRGIIYGDGIVRLFTSKVHNLKAESGSVGQKQTERRAFLPYRGSFCQQKFTFFSIFQNRNGSKRWNLCQNMALLAVMPLSASFCTWQKHFFVIWQRGITLCKLTECHLCLPWQLWLLLPLIDLAGLGHFPPIQPAWCIRRFLRVCLHGRWRSGDTAKGCPLLVDAIFQG